MLNHYHDAGAQEKAAVDAAERTLDFAMALYKQGATDYLTVVTSQTALLQTQLQALNLNTPAAECQHRSHPCAGRWPRIPRARRPERLMGSRRHG